MLVINDAETFEKEVLESDVPVLVDFYADWCGPCKMQGPVLEDLSGEIGEAAKICKINVDDNRSIAEKYSIQSIPTLIIFENGEVSKTLIGLQSKDNLKDALGV
jgi:thioredoxin 1